MEFERKKKIQQKWGSINKIVDKNAKKMIEKESLCKYKYKKRIKVYGYQDSVPVDKFSNSFDISFEFLVYRDTPQLDIKILSSLIICRMC